MTEYELHSLIADLFRDQDSMTEFWVSGTFAVIVARFAAGDALSRGTIWIMTLLYLAATGVSFSRYVLVYTRNLNYQEHLTSMGFNEFFASPLYVTLISIFNPTLIFGGTLATVYFLLRRRSSHLAGGLEPKESTG